MAQKRKSIMFEPQTLVPLRDRGVKDWRGVLVNNYGVKGVEEVTELDDHRGVTNPSAASRETMTDILASALTRFPTSDAPATIRVQHSEISQVEVVKDDPRSCAERADVA